MGFGEVEVGGLVGTAVSLGPDERPVLDFEAGLSAEVEEHVVIFEVIKGDEEPTVTEGVVGCWNDTLHEVDVLFDDVTVAGGGDILTALGLLDVVHVDAVREVTDDVVDGLVTTTDEIARTVEVGEGGCKIDGENGRRRDRRTGKFVEIGECGCNSRFEYTLRLDR